MRGSPNHSTAAKPATNSQCHSVGLFRRFDEPKRYLQIGHVSFRFALILIVSLLMTACGPIQEARMVPYEKREIRCIEQYRDGDVHQAKQALLDYSHLIQEEEASGLPFAKTAYVKALTAARLALIYQQLGETNLVNQELRRSIACARKDAQEEGNRSWLEKTDDQIMLLITNAVNKLDENTHPKWRVASAR